LLFISYSYARIPPITDFTQGGLNGGPDFTQGGLNGGGKVWHIRTATVGKNIKIGQLQEFCRSKEPSSWYFFLKQDERLDIQISSENQPG
jgi:hypothetical protein